MEAMRDVALAHHENLEDKEKAEMHNDFKREVANGSLSEYLKRNIDVDDHFSKHVDKYLEKYKGGSLDFNDFITLKYTVENVAAALRFGCSSLIIGVAYFTCWDCCYSSFNDTYDLCSSCYRSKKFQDHHHQNFVNNQTMQLMATSKLAAAINDRFVRDELIDFASTLMKISKSTEIEGWMNHRHELDKVSHQLKELVGLADAKKNAIQSTGEENKSTETPATSLPETQGVYSRIDLLGESASQPWINLDKSDEDEDEDDSTRFTPKPQRRINDLLGVKASKQWPF